MVPAHTGKMHLFVPFSAPALLCGSNGGCANIMLKTGHMDRRAAAMNRASINLQAEAMHNRAMRRADRGARRRHLLCHFFGDGKDVVSCQINYEHA